MGCTRQDFPGTARDPSRHVNCFYINWLLYNSAPLRTVLNSHRSLPGVKESRTRAGSLPPLLGRSSGRWPVHATLTEDSVLVRNGPGFVRRIVALQLPRVIPASQPLHHQSLAREHDEHLVVQRLGPAHTAPPTPPSPWSRPTRARRTRPRIGRSPRTVRPRLAFPPSTDAPASVRAGGADIEVRHRPGEGYSCWTPCVHRGLRSSRRPDQFWTAERDQFSREDGMRCTFTGITPRDSRFWPAARPRTRRRWRTSRRVIDEYHAQVEPWRGLDAMDVGTRSSTPRRLRKDLRTIRGDTERTGTPVLTNQGTPRFTWFQSVSRSIFLPRSGG